jgi:hypothetical protein
MISGSGNPLLFASFQGLEREDLVVLLGNQFQSGEFRRICLPDWVELAFCRPLVVRLTVNYVPGPIGLIDDLFVAKFSGRQFG